MSADDGERTFTALEIVKELFPATPEHLLPYPRRFRLKRADGGEITLSGPDGSPLLVLETVAQSGDPAHRLCCDLCRHSAPRERMAMLRLVVPGSHGRRWRYVTACRDLVQCEARRPDDAALERLLASL